MRGDTAAVDACDRKRFEERKASKVEGTHRRHLFRAPLDGWKTASDPLVRAAGQGGPART